MLSIFRVLPVLAASLLIGSAAKAEAPAYDFDNRNAAVEVAIQTIAPLIFEELSPTAGDASLVLRATAMTTNAWFDAVAPYHPTAVGLYSRLGRRPAEERATNRHMNIALVYATYRVGLGLFPGREADLRAMMEGVGLDPDDTSTDTSTAVGIGNLAGLGVLEGRLHDGMNQLGLAGGRTANPTPYADTTGYSPVNTPYVLNDPSRWQPDIQRKGGGLYRSQVFVTPQYGTIEPLAGFDPEQFPFPAPSASNVANLSDYRAQADEVLAVSANLTDLQKTMAEYFDNKIVSLGFSAVDAGMRRGLSMFDFVALDFATNMAAFDAGIVVWQEKAKHDAVRPFSAIRHLYGDAPVTAWGGPGRGTVEIPASEWASYMPAADHPEYPSATACFCAAHSQSARRLLGSDEMNYVVPFAAGSSRIEPGQTPAADFEMTFATWTEFSDICGLSRLWGGVHFRSAIEESQARCSVFGDLAADYIEALTDGTAPVRGPSLAPDR